jgi:hypothetical protein
MVRSESAVESELAGDGDDDVNETLLPPVVPFESCESWTAVVLSVASVDEEVVCTSTTVVDTWSFVLVDVGVSLAPLAAKAPPLSNRATPLETVSPSTIRIAADRCGAFMHSSDRLVVIAYERF